MKTIDPMDAEQVQLAHRQWIRARARKLAAVDEFVAWKEEARALRADADAAADVIAAAAPGPELDAAEARWMKAENDARAAHDDAQHALVQARRQEKLAAAAKEKAERIHRRVYGFPANYGTPSIEQIAAAVAARTV